MGTRRISVQAAAASAPEPQTARPQHTSTAATHTTAIGSGWATRSATSLRWIALLLLLLLLALPALASAFSTPDGTQIAPAAAAVASSSPLAADDGASSSAALVPASAAVPADAVSVAAVAAPAPSLVMACVYNAPSGVRFDNLIRFQSQFSDYLWTGDTTDGSAGSFRVQIAVCQTSHTASCSQALGGVCVYNLTSLASHLPNVTLPTDLIVAGRLNYIPVPTFSALDPDDDTAGVVLTYDNSPLGYLNAWHTVVQLRCDNRFLTANISAVDLAPSQMRITISMAALWACPTFVPPGDPAIAPWQIALVACAAFVVLYFSLGCCWQAMVKGKPCGWQTCPHPTIWVKAPRAVCGACAACCTYFANGCNKENDTYREL